MFKRQSARKAIINRRILFIINNICIKVDPKSLYFYFADVCLNFVGDFNGIGLLQTSEIKTFYFGGSDFLGAEFKRLVHITLTKVYYIFVIHVWFSVVNVGKHIWTSSGNDSQVHISRFSSYRFFWFVEICMSVQKKQSISTFGFKGRHNANEYAAITSQH